MILKSALLLFIENEKAITTYRVFPMHHGAWKLVKVDDRTEYLCSVDRGEATCSCPDHINRRHRCKHLAALIELGLLPGGRHADDPVEESRGAEADRTAP